MYIEALCVTGICRIEVIYHVISSNLVTSAFTHHELEKIASAFDLDVGQLLLLETNNLNDAVLVGSKRTIYFSTETSKQQSYDQDRQSLKISPSSCNCSFSFQLPPL